MIGDKGSYAVGDELDVRVIKLVPQGLGLGFAERLTVFVPLAAAGDVVRVRIDRLQKRTAFAKIIEVLEPSPQRVEPRCPHFGICGGCDLQHITYEAQLGAKSYIVSDCLLRIGRIDTAGEIKIVPNPQPYGYRGRARWHADRVRRTIGYYGHGSHDVVDIETCPILMPDLLDAFIKLRHEIDWDTMWSERLEIDAVCGDNRGVSIVSSEQTEPIDEVTVTTSDTEYTFSARAFFQGSLTLLKELLDAALDGVSGSNALDLYSGVGLFTLPIARHFAHVTGVEGNAYAVEFARKNAKKAGLDNINFVARGVRDHLATLAKENIDFVLLDPPRSGTEKSVIAEIARLGPREICYVSCEPSILARDLRSLLDAGYLLDKVLAFDMFPQTHHVETVARLRRS